jgi:hypothetical protein
MAKAKKAKPAPKAEKKVEKREPEFEAAFLKGRHARKSGIRREDSPLLGDLGNAWAEGWDYQDKAM